MNLLEKQLELAKQGKSYALVSVVETDGNSPYETGKKMLLLPDGQSFGTVGGGSTELEIKRDALAAIGSGESYLRTYAHRPENDEEAGLGCEFTAAVFVEIFLPPPHVVVCGGGHVGGAVLQLAKFLRFDTTLIDLRGEEELQNSLPFADFYYRCEDYGRGVLEAAVPDGAFYFLGASTHTQDKSALGGVLRRPHAYVGMLGSRLKTKEIFPQLIREGIDRSLLDEVHTPVGLDIANSMPEEIALAVMAEILLVKNGRQLRPRGEKKLDEL